MGWIILNQTGYLRLGKFGGQHLQSAEEALKRPFADEGYAQAVLVPIREAIQGTIDQLLKRRRSADKTSSWINKVTSIAVHCGKTGLSSEYIDRVAATTHTLINELSAAKDRKMGRERITSLFDQSISLIQDIVSLIDKDRLRGTLK